MAPSDGGSFLTSGNAIVFYYGNASAFSNTHFDNIRFESWKNVWEVAIDIKPGSDPNSINPRSNGVIPVAILTTA